MDIDIYETPVLCRVSKIDKITKLGDESENRSFFDFLKNSTISQSCFRIRRSEHNGVLFFFEILEIYMGIFDAFKAKPPELTPRLSLAVGLLFMMSADGVIEQEDIGVLLASLHGDQRLLDDAFTYGRASNIDDFLASSATLLNEAQKHCVLLNLADALLSDGNAAAQEKNLFDRFLKTWNVSETDFKSSLEIIMRKNDHSVLGN